MALLPVLLDVLEDLYDNLENPSKTEISKVPLLYLPHRGVQEGCPRKNRHQCARGETKECPAKLCSEKAEAAKETQSAPSECSKECQKKGKCERVKLTKDTPMNNWNALALYDHPWVHGYPYDLLRQIYKAQRPCPTKTPDDFEVVLNVKSFKPEEISVKVKGRDILIEGKHEERAEDSGFVSRHFTRRYVLSEDYDIDSVSSYWSADGQMTIRASKPKPVVQTNERIIPIERVTSIPKAAEEKKGSDTSSETSEGKKNAEFELVDDPTPQ